jgi:uncharacterized membrane protein
MATVFKLPVLCRALVLVASDSWFFAAIMFAVVYFNLPLGFLGNFALFWGAALVFFVIRVLVAAVLLGRRLAKDRESLARFESMTDTEKAAAIMSVDRHG